MKTKTEITTKVQKEIYGKLLGMYIFYLAVGVVGIVACSTLYALYEASGLFIAVICVSALCAGFGAFFVMYLLRMIKQADSDKISIEFDFGEEEFTVTTYKKEEKTKEKTYSYKNTFYKETKNFLVLYAVKNDPLPIDNKAAEKECSFVKEKIKESRAK